MIQMRFVAIISLYIKAPNLQGMLSMSGSDAA
jgi:hypothetical protein